MARVGCPADPAPPVEWVAEYDTSAKPPDRLAPGTVVGSSAPAGWSHLVIKRPAARAILTRSRCCGKRFPFAAGEGIRLTTWMFTAFTADVR